MRGILWVIIGLLWSPLALCAAEWIPYIGGAPQYDIAFAHYGLQNLARSGTLHDFGCWGSQWEAGLSSPRFSVYAAYHFSVSSVYARESAVYLQNATGTQVSSQVEENSWREKRGIVGVRWLMNGADHAVVKPLVGAALTLGKSRLGWTQTQRSYPAKTLMWQENSSRTSSLSIGQMIEFGFLIQTHSPLAITVLAQCHRYEADFGKSVPYVPADHYIVLLPGWQIGARYSFSGLSLGN